MPHYGHKIQYKFTKSVVNMQIVLTFIQWCFTAVNQANSCSVTGKEWRWVSWLKHNIKMSYNYKELGKKINTCS
jgi:hypothetical protein